MTKQNYIRHCESGRQQHIRIPLVNEINAYEPEAYASWLAGYRTENTVFEFLTYHEYGKEKWTEEYLVKDGFVSDETVDEFRKTFEKHGLKVVTT
jgi:pyruvate-formate lyase-activating enzyme